MSQAAIEQLIAEHVAKAMEDDRATRWFKKMEMVFSISECAEGKKVNFAVAALQGRALTWWNTQVATLGLETANGHPWVELRKLMTAEFCPMDEVQRMEHELWGLMVKNLDISAYTNHFHELALLCPTMVEPEYKKIEAYIRGLSEDIKGDIISSRPADLNEAVRMANSLMNQRVQAMAKRIAGVLRGSGIYSKVEAIITTTTTTTTETIPTTTNIITEGTFLLNNHYVIVLFDSGSDKSFVSTNFSTLIDINPVRLDTSYEVELVNGKIVSTNTVLSGCTLILANHLFKIDLMPIKLGTFEVIIGMDWLSKCETVIVCGKKIVCIPYNNKMLIVEGDRGVSRLKIISCIKAQKYIERGCQLYLAQVTEKEPIEKHLEDVPVIRNFPEISLLLTPLCCDDIHDVMPRVSALAGCDRLGPYNWCIVKFELSSWRVVELMLGTYLWVVRYDRGVTEGREDVRVVFQQRGSGAKRKLSRCGRNQMGNEPILALLKGADDFIVYYDVRSKDLKACLEKGRRLRLNEAKVDDGCYLVEFDIEDNHGLDLESPHSLLCCRTCMVVFERYWNTHFRKLRFSLRWGLSFEYGCASFEAWLWVVEGLTLERCSTFGKKDKLEPSYVGPFEILGWIGPIVRLRISVL
ncbi:putative reverse transcriptase domain-containing protein [Tanacetum coccineum]